MVMANVIKSNFDSEKQYSNEESITFHNNSA